MGCLYIYSINFTLLKSEKYEEKINEFIDWYYQDMNNDLVKRNLNSLNFTKYH